MVTAVHSQLECGLSFMLLSLTCTTYHLTVHTATIWSPYKHSARTDFFFFPMWRNSVIHLCFTCTLVSDAILLNCPSAAIYHAATKCDGYWWEGSPSAAIPPPSASYIVGQPNKTEGIIFGACLTVNCFLFLAKSIIEVLRGKLWHGV